MDNNEIDEWFEAARQGELEILRKFIENGQQTILRPPRTFWQIDIQDKEWGDTALLIAANNERYQCIQLLLEAGAFMEKETIWFDAAMDGHIEILRICIEHGQQVDIQDNHNGWTALMEAAKNGHYQCVELLLEAGADPSKLTEIRCSPKIQPVVKDFEGQLENQLLKAYSSAGLDFILIPDLAKWVVRFIIPKLQ